MAYYINNRCISCRLCDIHCPMDAIKYGNRGYTILSDRCVECGACLKYCNVGAIINPNAKPSYNMETPKMLACDLVVLGGGGAGMVAAVRAAQLTGLNVIVLEKGQNSGGSAWCAVGMRVG